MREVNPNFV